MYYTQNETTTPVLKMHDLLSGSALRGFFRFFVAAFFFGVGISPQDIAPLLLPSIFYLLLLLSSATHYRILTIVTTTTKIPIGVRLLTIRLPRMKRLENFRSSRVVPNG